MEMVLDKKQILAIFKFSFKMGHKASETTCNIKKTFAPGSPKEHRVQWWFKKFFKGEESLDDEEHSGWLSEVDNDQLRASSKYILLKLHYELEVDYSMVIWHLKQIGKVKKLNTWVSHEPTKKKNKLSFWSVVFSYYMQQQTIFNWIVACNMWQKVDFIW